MNPPPPRSRSGAIFLTVFLDIVGFSILFPLYPGLLRFYVDREGADSFVGELVSVLSGWADGDEFATVVLFGAVLGSLYSVLQFLFAPVWGSLSDRLGRRPILLWTIAGGVVSYAIWAISAQFSWFVASRLLGGMMAGNIATASAVVADTTTDRNRSRGMAVVGMAIGLGFVCGPALGGVLAGMELGASTDTAAWGLHPYSAAALGSLAMAALNWLWVARRLPESHPPERRLTRTPGARTLRPWRLLQSLPFPGIASTNGAYFCYLTAFAAMEFTLTFLAVERFSFSPSDNAWMFVFVGLVAAFVQGGFVRRQAARIGEQRLAVAGVAATIPGLLLVGLAPDTRFLYAGLFLMACGSSCVTPCLSALLSQYTPVDRQGLSLGVFRSMGSLSRALGPLLGGVAYWQWGSRAPYLMGAVFLLAPVWITLRLPPLPRRTESP